MDTGHGFEPAAEPLASLAAEFDQSWLKVQDGVELRVFRWRPRGGEDETPLVFVAGWVSVVEGWLPVLQELVKRRRVVYIETREKRSARIDGKLLGIDAFGVDRLADDLIRIAAEPDGDAERAVWFGSSMGANAILEALKGGRLPARGAFLVGPNSSFRIPWWGWPVLRMPAALYHVFKPFIIWYLRHFRIDERAEPEQMRRYVRTLDAADPLRLKLSARAIVDYAVWPELDTITVPVTIAFAATDRLHSVSEVTAIVTAIPGGRIVECPSNAAMHDARIIEPLERFIAELDSV